MNLGKLPPHLRLFFSLAGLGAGVIAILCYAALSFRAGVPLDQINLPISFAIGLSALIVFYRFQQLISTRTIPFMLWRGLVTWSQVVILVLLFNLIAPSPAPALTRELLAQWALMTPIVLLPALVVMRIHATYLYNGPHYVRHAIFVLPGYQAQTLAIRLRRSPSIGIIVDGYFGDHDPLLDPTPTQQGLKHLGGLGDVVPHLKAQKSNIAFISMTLMRTPYAQEILDQLSDSTAGIYLVPESPSLHDFQVNIDNMAGVPLLKLHDTQILGVARGIKRSMDVIVASMMLCALAIPMGIIALMVRSSSPGPILFKQTRYGLEGQPIQVMKFRSMYVNQPDPGAVKQATRDDPRITPIGRILRKSSLDELPQLFNILNGSMSLVGPRPHAAEHNEFYRQQIKGYMLRHTVKPGLTGWAQVNGLRGETDTLDKMMKRAEYDRYYIQHWTPLLDIKILFRTALLVIHDEKAY